MSVDTFDTTAGASVLGPATRCFAVTPSDSVDLAFTARAIYVGVGGDISILTPGSSTPVVLKNTAAGTVLPVAASRINAAGTTASSLVALY